MSVKTRNVLNKLSVFWFGILYLQVSYFRFNFFSKNIPHLRLLNVSKQHEIIFEYEFFTIYVKKLFVTLCTLRRLIYIKCIVRKWWTIFSFWISDDLKLIRKNLNNLLVSVCLCLEKKSLIERLFWCQNLDDFIAPRWKAFCFNYLQKLFSPGLINYSFISY